MCLAIPVRVVRLLGQDFVEGEVGGVFTRVSIALVDAVAIGDYLIVHAGFAIARLDVEEAEKTLALFETIAGHLKGTENALHPRIS